MILQHKLMTQGEANPRQAAFQAAAALADVKAKSIVVVDFGGKSSFTDYFVLATGDSPVHMRALANRVNEALTQHRLKEGRAEGQNSQNWMLLDYGTVVVHIFSRQARDYYAIDELWGDAQLIPWSDEYGKLLENAEKENGTWH